MVVEFDGSVCIINEEFYEVQKSLLYPLQFSRLSLNSFQCSAVYIQSFRLPFEAWIVTSLAAEIISYSKIYIF